MSIVSDKVRSPYESLFERKILDMDKKKALLKAGGSVKTQHKVDSQKLCREIRGK